MNWKFDLIFIYLHIVIQVNDDFLMTLATEQSRIDSLDLSYCTFTEDGLQYLGKVTGFHYSICGKTRVGSAMFKSV